MGAGGDGGGSSGKSGDDGSEDGTGGAGRGGGGRTAGVMLVGGVMFANTFWFLMAWVSKGFWFIMIIIHFQTRR